MLESVLNNRDGRLTIKVKGRFDYSCHNEFKEAFSAVQAVTSYEVNLADAVYLDSSALGMLLLLREHAGEKKVSLIHVSDAVLHILHIANFQQLFDISQ